MKIAVAQINSLVGDLDYNLKTIISYVAQAKQSGAELIVFPELSLIGYPPKDLILKPSLLDLQEYCLKELALYTEDNFAIIVGGVSRNTDNAKLYNSAFCIKSRVVDQIIHKTLLPNYDVFDETRYFESSPEVNIWNYRGNKFGVTICEDIWIEAYPNLYKRNPINELIFQGADMLINIAASPYSFNKPALREVLFSNLIKKYQLPLIYVNQVGANDELIFDGSSRIFNSQAELVLSAKSFVEDLLIFESNSLVKEPSGTSNWQTAKIHSISDTSIKSTIDILTNSELEEITQALVLGIKDYVHKCKFDKIIIGLSGGIDSALVAALAAKAIGPQNVYAYMLRSEFTSKASLYDAQLLATNLGINYEVISIKELHDLTRKLIPELSPLADENLQPRLRANILMAQANSLNGILLATGNKSEIAVGYSTIYGDTCGALAPIGDLLKTTVFQLTRYLNKDTQIIPESILNKAPSAELRHDQKDSDSLPEYELLDKIILLYIQELKSYKDIIAIGFDSTITKQVLNMIDKAEYKRQQSPPILKIATKAFGVGRRMPIAQGFKHR